MQRQDAHTSMPTRLFVCVHDDDFVKSSKLRKQPEWPLTSVYHAAGSFFRNLCLGVSFARGKTTRLISSPHIYESTCRMEIFPLVCSPLYSKICRIFVPRRRSNRSSRNLRPRARDDAFTHSILDLQRLPSVVHHPKLPPGQKCKYGLGTGARTPCRQE